MATKIFGCWNGATKILFVPGNEVSSVASPWTAGANLFTKTVLLTVVRTILIATGIIQGINGLFGTPVTVSGGNNAWTNLSWDLLKNTFTELKGDVTGFAGYKHGPLSDGLSIVAGPISKGILVFF